MWPFDRKDKTIYHSRYNEVVKTLAKQHGRTEANIEDKLVAVFVDQILLYGLWKNGGQLAEPLWDVNKIYEKVREILRLEKVAGYETI